jgi:hypothetical protein
MPDREALIMSGRETMDSGLMLEQAGPVSGRSKNRRHHSSCFLLTFGVLHLVPAADIGFSEIRTNDRHLLAPATQFGVLGRSVGGIKEN